MIEFHNGGRLVQDVSELPDLRNAKTLHADFETTSGDPAKKSTDPFHDCWTAGVAVTADEHKGAWYVPVGHHCAEGNLPIDAVAAWWCDVVSSAQEWDNQNIKYDAHVSTNSLGVLPTEPRMVCALTKAKIIDSDRMSKGGYGLDALSRAWLGEDIGHFELAMKPYLYRNKDYGAIPQDVMAAYACQDVITNRRLRKYTDARMPVECEAVRDVEIGLTPVLFDIERTGMRVDTRALQIKELSLLRRLMEIDEELTRITGRSFRPHVGGDCFDVLCNQYGLPVLAWTGDKEDEDDEEPGNPSFDKHALAAYASHPFAPREVVDLIMEYRKLNTLNSLFISKWQEFEVDGRLHPSYNQAVRTGRLSCKKPNAQQVTSVAKELVIPPDGETFVSADYSQIEFRFIVHYIQDDDAIAAYVRDPDTDFHAWVAEMCEIHRGPAKNVNFAMAFGGGEARVLSMLSSNMQLVGDIGDKVRGLVDAKKIEEAQSMEVFEMLCGERAKSVYDRYHSTLPSLKRTSYRASRKAKSAGYVFNVIGRRRHLPETRSHIAFNAIIQSSAADLQKERTVALRSMLPSCVKIIALVHDETLMQGPSEVVEDPRFRRDLADVMEHSDVIQLRVPIRVSVGLSRTSWAHAAKDTSPVFYDRKQCEQFRWVQR